MTWIEPATSGNDSHTVALWLQGSYISGERRIRKRGLARMVIEAGVAVGYVISWALRKAGRVADGVNAEVDASIDAGLEKLHTVVAAKLGGHPAMDDLAEEAASDDGQVSELTRQQVELALTAAARKDEVFAQAVTGLIADVRTAEQADSLSIVAGAGAVVFTGDAHVQVDKGGIAFGQVAGSVHVERSAEEGPRLDPSEPGRSRP